MPPAPFSADHFELVLQQLASAQRRFLGDIASADVSRVRGMVARELASAVAAGRYELSPGQLARVNIEGKDRDLMRSTLLDAAVDRAAGQWLAAAIEPSLPECVYSYRKGRGQVDALRRLAAELREVQREVPDPTERWVYVLRRDVRSYGDTIPVDESSPLWPMLDRATAARPASERRIGLPLLEALIRRDHLDLQGDRRRLSRGSPTGSSVQPSVNNLFLVPLDRRMMRMGLYLRFGDDVAFVSRDRARAEEAEGVMDREVNRLGLSWKHEKSLRVCLNMAARPGPAGWQGRDQVELLGYGVTARGGIRLPPAKWTRAVQDLRFRLETAAREPALASEPPEVRAAVLGAVLQHALDPTDLRGIRDASALSQWVDDRGQLRQLDKLLRLWVADLATGIRGPRAYRVLPPRKLIDLGVPSLEHRRNHPEGQGA
ncbi:MAG: hypothetical protein EA397_15810 [Deltaproteobacteria bacterium]|nr:MAG: hypothetical protein EA397_15810 [Deltaproteobacteria bacterium]